VSVSDVGGEIRSNSAYAASIRARATAIFSALPFVPCVAFVSEAPGRRPAAEGRFLLGGGVGVPGAGDDALGRADRKRFVELALFGLLDPDEGASTSGRPVRRPPALMRAFPVRRRHGRRCARG
jgi:hypothetical protein